MLAFSNLTFTTHPSRDGAPFLHLIETPPTLGADYVFSIYCIRSVLLILSLFLFRRCLCNLAAGDGYVRTDAVRLFHEGVQQPPRLERAGAPNRCELLHVARLSKAAVEKTQDGQAGAPPAHSGRGFPKVTRRCCTIPVTLLR